MGRSMKLWYKEAAKSWNEALPIGNGRLGAMVFGDPFHEKIQLNEDSIWSGKKLDRINPDALKSLPKIRKLIREGRIPEAEQLCYYGLSGTPNSQRSYQTAGECYINMHYSSGNDLTAVDDENNLANGKMSNYSRELSLENAVCKTVYSLRETTYSREIFSSFPDGIMAMKLEATGKGKLDFDVHLERCHNAVDKNGRDEETNTIWFDMRTGENGIGFRVACRAVNPNAGGQGISIIGTHLIVKDISKCVLLFSIETSFRRDDYRTAVSKQIDRAMKLGFEALLARHEADYKELFERVKLNLDGERYDDKPTDIRLQNLKNGITDKGLIETYFQYGRYLLIASSREGSLPANLQGLWNDQLYPVWESKYTININTEMNYWPAEAAALPECQEPFFTLLYRIMENGKKTARQMYGCSGSVAHHNTDVYADTAPQDLGYPCSYWVMGEAWMATHIWKHYKYTKDESFLRENFDVLKESVEFFEDFLIEKDGYLITSPSVSPENTYIQKDGTKGVVCEGSTMDVEILTELFTDFISACEVLRKDKSNAEKAAETMKRFPPLRIGKHGQIMEWLEDYDEEKPGHRHISHLYGLFPGHMITENDSKLYDAAKKTLERRLSYGGGHTGWSRAWIISLWARLGEGDKAYENLLELIKGSTFKNLFDNHPMFDYFVFQIDGNFGAVSGILNMLIQCDGDNIKLLPSLPKALDKGSVSGIRIPGRKEISFAWENGKVIEGSVVTKEI